MLPGQLAESLSPAPILLAAEGYRGTFVDLDRGWSVSPDVMARAREHLARQFRSAGLRSGDRVVMGVGNGPLFVATLTALLAEEGSPLLLHARTPASELRRTAQRFGAPWLVTDECPLADLQQQQVVVERIAGAPWIELHWGRIDDSPAASSQSEFSLPGVPLHPTSGTTGGPKIAARGGRCAVEEARHYIDTLAIDGSDTLVAVTPMSHAYAYGMAVMVPLLSGAHVVSMRKFSPKLVFRALREHGATILPATPSMLDLLMFGAGSRLRPAPRCVLSAGSPLSRRTAERFYRLSGSYVRPLYGTTETGGITVADCEEASAMAPGCVGRPMRGVDVRLEVDTAPAPLGPHTAGTGTLCVRSSSMMAGYMGASELDRSALEDQWFRTGDLAWIDSSGAIHLKGRVSEMINVAGMKVVPSDVEEVILALPGVVEVKVYPGCGRSGGQFVKAAVVADRRLEESQIRAHCERHLVYYKCPERICRVDALPRSPAGKIVIDQLP